MIDLLKSSLVEIIVAFIVTLIIALIFKLPFPYTVGIILMLSFLIVWLLIDRKNKMTSVTQAYFGHQKLEIFVTEAGDIKNVVYQQKIINCGPGYLSNFNHSLYSPLTKTLDNVEVAAGDSEGPLNQISIKTHTSTIIDFFVNFRKSLAPKEKYEYFWKAQNINAFFDISTSEWFWDYSPQILIKSAELKVIYMTNKNIGNCKFVTKTTDQVIAPVKVKKNENGWVVMETSVKTLKPGQYRISWTK